MSTPLIQLSIAVVQKQKNECFLWSTLPWWPTARLTSAVLQRWTNGAHRATCLIMPRAPGFFYFILFNIYRTECRVQRSMSPYGKTLIFFIIVIVHTHVQVKGQSKAGATFILQAWHSIQVGAGRGYLYGLWKLERYAGLSEAAPVTLEACPV